jgi:hypothetical protein
LGCFTVLGVVLESVYLSSATTCIKYQARFHFKRVWNMANTRKKRGRSKGGEVAAPTNEVTTSVEAGGVPLTDTQPPKKKRGRRSKRKVGSENEPVETAPEDGELNISEEGVTEATATTILQVTDSTEVGGGGAEEQRCRCRDAEMQRYRGAGMQRCRYLGGGVMQR